ncbi:hypothetical protein [Streptomyces sp. NBC_01264]|uniref:hypothetical protein n=1 Tax=Streptomyces sp. NBC_01264 TaxID=2903804 RepID=UPI0022520362|nr:hypothetical protein [Streptomyces sp. NBC_01264]MCX4784424.1 hypothetical protein [Streptomyces sp. NBC_01264]
MTSHALAAGIELSNLKWVAMRTMSGSVTWMLRIDHDPHVEPGGVYFLWNPDTSSRAGNFAIGDDVRIDTVTRWKGAIFAPTPGADHIEVRYGQVDAPGEAVIVASIARCPSHLIC